MDYGLCPTNVKIVGTCIPATSNDGWEIVNTRAYPEDKCLMYEADCM